MTVFIIRRLLQAILVVWAMSFLVFSGVNLVGDPVEMMVNDEADQGQAHKKKYVQHCNGAPVPNGPDERPTNDSLSFARAF